MGALAASLVLAANIAVEPTASFADVRNGIALVNKWLLAPSLLIVLVSGLLAIWRPRFTRRREAAFGAASS